MLFKNVQNLVDIVSNLRGTFDFRRPWPIKAHAWCWCLAALAVRRSEWCCQHAEQKAGHDRRFFLLVSTFLPSRHDVLREGPSQKYL